MIHPETRRMLSFAIPFAAVLMLSGCYDVRYDYDVPAAESDCPSGLEFRSGGSAIVDRSGGSAIVDRNDDQVMNYCYVDSCPGGNYDNTIPAEIDWHLDDHRQVIATRTCLALPPPPTPTSGSTTGSGSTSGGTTPVTGGTSTTDPDDDSDDRN